MNNLHSLLIVLTAAFVTIAIRFAPFIIFAGNKKTPKFIEHLGKVLSPAIMGMLVIFCLKGISFQSINSFMPLILASLSVVAIHLWKRNTLLSIIGGTAIYMLLVQLVFI